MTNIFKTTTDMQSGTISICDNNHESTKRFTCLIDEWPAIMESGQAEYEKAKVIMSNSLLDTRGIDEAMRHYERILNSGSSTSFSAMVEFYQNMLVLLSGLHDALDSVIGESTIKRVLLTEIELIKVWRDKLAAILEAHKQHMPE